VVAGSVVAGDAGPIGDDDYRQAVEADVKVPLVDRPGEKRQ